MNDRPFCVCSPTWTRTKNLPINSRLLCQLSYWGMVLPWWRTGYESTGGEGAGATGVGVVWVLGWVESGVRFVLGRAGHPGMRQNGRCVRGTHG